MKGSRFSEEQIMGVLREHKARAKTEEVCSPAGILERNPALAPALATVVMRAIRRDPDKRYASMRDLLYDLCHLEEMGPVDYHPDHPRLGGRYRQAIRLAFIILVVLLGIIASGIIAQAIHGLAR